MGGARGLIGVALIACAMSACDRAPGEFPLGFDAKIYPGSQNHLFTYVPSDQLPAGAIIRAMYLPGTPSGIPQLRNSCPIDISRIRPTASEEPYPDYRTERSPKELAHILHIVMPGAREAPAEYVDRIQLRFQDVQRVALADGEAERVKKAISRDCRSAIRVGQQQERHQYFLVTAFIRVSVVNVVVFYKSQVAQKSDFDPKRVRVNGIQAHLIHGIARTVHQGNNLIVELNPDKLENF